MELVFKIIGGLGIALISLGILDKNRFRGTFLYLLGGICLESYSIFIGDEIFMALQAIFILVVSYKLVTLHKK